MTMPWTIEQKVGGGGGNGETQRYIKYVFGVDLC